MFFDRLKKNKAPELDPNVADQMLQNVFDMCEMESNTVPLEVLESYAQYRYERFALQKTLLIVIMVLFCMLPLLFIAPDYTLEEQAESAHTPVYELKIHNRMMPIRYVTAKINGESIPVHDKGNRVYSVEPDTNGTVTVRVELSNRQYVEKTIGVTTVDTEIPELVQSELVEDKARLHVEDNASGIDYDAIYAIDNGGTRIYPVSVDEEKGIITFDFQGEEIHVYIPDHAENVLQLLLKTSS